MRLDLFTLFPEIAAGPLGASMIGKAVQRGLVDLRIHQLRDWATDKHRTTDDTPYGGSQGMVMKCEPFFAAIEALIADCGLRIADSPEAGAEESKSASIEEAAHSSSDTAPLKTNPQSAIPNPQFHTILLSPAGRPLTQKRVEELAQMPHLVLLCGHYEGVDQRVVDHLVDEEISIGDYVLTNGALAAAVLADAVIRLLPGVLGDANSAPDDSHSSGLLEFPQYTRPVEFRGWRVPDVLLSGHHAEIAKWRKERALEKTRRVRPDLLEP